MGENRGPLALESHPEKREGRRCILFTEASVVFDFTLISHMSRHHRSCRRRFAGRSIGRPRSTCGPRRSKTRRRSRFLIYPSPANANRR